MTSRRSAAPATESARRDGPVVRFTSWSTRADRTGPVGLRPLSTVRARLTVLGTVVVAAMLIVSALALVGVQHRLLLAGVDEALRQRVDNIQSSVAGPGRRAVLVEEGDREDSFLQVIDPSGEVFAASPNIQGYPAATTPPPPGADQVLRTVTGVAISPHPFRVLAQQVQTASGPKTLLAGKNLDDVQGSVAILATSLSVLVPLILALLALLIWWVSGRALRPVDTIRAEVEAITGHDLGRRVQVSPSNDEIARLAGTMNAMLDRIQNSTEQQRRFVADASHELRTPLTRLRSELELLLADPTEPRASCYALLTDTVELQNLVDDLLFMARSQAYVPDTRTELVDLDDLILAEARRLRAGGRVGVDTTTVGPARVLGVPSELARMARNLVTNAERHARTTVWLQSHESHRHSVLVVSDDGPGIPTDQRSAVFQRFTRLDAARSRDAGGAGLGLAIVNDVVQRHRGSVSITSSPTGGAQFTVTLPRAD
jgi:signal transduction histidine kinase